MELHELNRIVRNKAIENGLCSDWQNNVWNRELSVREMLQIYVKGIDFSIKNDWLDNEFIKANADRDLLRECGIFIDEKVNEENVTTAVVMGKSSGSICYDGMMVGSVYVRHGSELEITASDGARVFVEVHDNAKIHAVADDESKIFVYLHGGHATREGNVTFRDRTKRS